MRIVHVIEYFQPQIGYQESFIAREQVRAGHDVHVVTSDRYYNRPDYDKTWKSVLGPRLVGTGFSEYDGIKIHRLDVLFEYSIRLWLKNVWQKIESLEPELVIVHNSETPLPIGIAYLARIKGKNFKLIFDNHANSINSRHPLRKIYYAVYRLLVAPILSSVADRIIAIDPESKCFLTEDCGIDDELIAMVPLAADSNRFRFDREARKAIRQKLEFADNETVFIYGGKLEPRKGLDLMVDALNQLNDQAIKAKLLLVGNGADELLDNIRSQIRNLGLNHLVTFQGTVLNSDLYKYYSAADVAIWARTVSIGTMEAQACELPLIVANTILLSDRIKYNNGIAFEKENVDDLASKMMLLAQDHTLRKKLGENGRKAIEEHLNWEKIANDFIRLAYRPSV